MHIELHRTFRELLRDNAKGDDTTALTAGNAMLTLPELLSERRVVILSEAGSGKTEEIREAARRLRAEGKAAFFLRLEHVTVDFDSAFEEGTLYDFQAWLASSEEGWVLLDSIDEARLRSSQEFAAAIRIVSSRLATAKQRTHLLITGRAPAWRPKSDLDICDTHFPVANENITASVIADLETTAGLKHAAAMSSASPFRIVTLESLSTAQIKHFAKEKGIEDTSAFLDAIERADALSFTARPQDLDELTGFWVDTGAIGTRLDLMTNSVMRRLKEPDQTRAESRPLSKDRALEGAQIIAGALMLTNQQTIQIPDGVQGSSGLQLDEVLPDWPEKEIGTLLQRSLFTPDIYGTVRFHHRSVKEYLAAQWFFKLLSHETSRRKVEELFFRQQYGLEVVVPSLRPLLPWLAMIDDHILIRVRKIAPEIVFEGGDPVQLPADIRSSMLIQICDQLDSGISTRSLADFAAIQRFAAQDITETVCLLIEKYRDNDDIVFFLMRMVWQGRLHGALTEAVNIACSPSARYTSRIAAFRAVAEIGAPTDMTSVRKKFACELDPLNRYSMADLLSHINQPDEQELQWLLKCIPRLDDYNDFDATGLSEEVANFFQRSPLLLVSRGLKSLQGFLASAPFIDSGYCKISKRYQWLREAAGVAVCRLISARDASALTPSSLASLNLVPVDGQFNVRSFDVERLGLAQAVMQWPELKWALFWHTVEQERKEKVKKGERVVDAWMALVTAVYVAFDSTDFDAAVQTILDKTLGDDKLVSLTLAFRLYLQSDRQPSRKVQLQKTVGANEQLRTRLTELLAKPKKSVELIRIEREQARLHRKAAARRAKEAKAQLEAPGKLEKRLEALRDPGFDDPSSISYDQHYMYHQMSRLKENKGGSRWTNGNWRELEREFGEKTPRAFRDGMVRFWRGHSPMLLSEGAARNSRPLADIFGLAGLTIEATENPGLFWDLSVGDVEIAFRYAMCELNGFPHWFSSLSGAHLETVKTMALNEVAFELQVDQESALSQYIIFDLSRVGDWLWDSIAPEIVKLLRTHPPKSSVRLLQLLTIIQSSKLPDATVAALAAEKMTSASGADHLPIWAASWTGVDSGAAIDALETHLATLSSVDERTQFTMDYVSNLLGSRGMTTSGVRAGYRLPAILRRLYLLVHEHVRVRDDIDRVNEGAYSPGLRDNAQDARERLVGILLEIPGKDAYQALKVISDSHPEESLRPWFTQQAKAKAETDSERPVWSAEQVNQFDKDFQRTPANHRELFDLAVMRLVDLKYELEDGDASTATVLIQSKEETVLRNFIGAWCNRSALSRYFAPQEEELPDAKRPDIRWHGIGFKGAVPIELKVADNWTGPQLFERLEGQLAGDYLRDDASNRGIYLLVDRGTQGHWQLPDGRMGNFDQLVLTLQAHWESVATAHSGIEEIKVIGIDLTKRAKTPLPKKRPSAKTVSNKSVAKSTSSGAAGKRSDISKAIANKESVAPTATKIPMVGMATKKVPSKGGATTKIPVKTAIAKKSSNSG